MNIIVGIIIFILVICLFSMLYKPFGEMPSNKDKEYYNKKAANYKDGKFYNESKFQMLYNTNTKNKFVSKKSKIPIDNIPIEEPKYNIKTDKEDFSFTWFGHSTILLNINNKNILIDPVFSKRASPVSFLGPKRFSKIPDQIQKLPNIDIVLISHDHYDHLDYTTIKTIDRKVNKYIVPLGVENHLKHWDISENKIKSLAWWEETKVEDLTIACTPSRHYSGRKIIDRYNTLWASWVFINKFNKIYYSGDTGFDKHFEEINKKYGNFDLSFLDCGQYDVKWKSTHMIPEESVKVAKMLKTKVAMPVHWGAFKLANHPWDDSVERFTKSAEKEKLQYITPKIGQTINYNSSLNINKWWKEVE